MIATAGRSFIDVARTLTAFRQNDFIGQSLTDTPSRQVLLECSDSCGRYSPLIWEIFLDSNLASHRLVNFMVPPVLRTKVRTISEGNSTFISTKCATSRSAERNGPASIPTPIF